VWATGHVFRSSSQIGYGSAAQTSSVWSKSVAQSLAGGRGVPAALLRWTMDQARGAGAAGLRARYRPNGRNVRLAVLLRQLGFARAGQDGETIVFRRPLAGELPPYPEWLEITAS